MYVDLNKKISMSISHCVQYKGYDDEFSDGIWRAASYVNETRVLKKYSGLK